MDKNREQKLIMIIEDEKLLLEAIAKKLDIKGLKALPYDSGESALEYLETQNPVPDGIWLDYHLRGMDGLQFVEKLKANPLWKSIPIVIVSNSASEEVVNNILALGADKYILKAKHRLEDAIEILEEIIASRIY